MSCKSEYTQTIKVVLTLQGNITTKHECATFSCFRLLIISSRKVDVRDVLRNLSRIFESFDQCFTREMMMFYMDFLPLTRSY